MNKGSKKVFKDPDVWDPPPPIEKRPPAKRISKNLSYAPQNLNRNKTNQPARNKKGDGEKKGFLQERYADGNGPDSNLIEMLER